MMGIRIVIFIHAKTRCDFDMCNNHEADGCRKCGNTDTV